MATTPTTYYAFGKPGKGDTGWWAVLNASLDAVDTTIKGIQNQIDFVMHAGAIHITSQVVQNVQGAWLGWNRSAGQGEMNLICHRGGGIGGFVFDTTLDATNFTRVGSLDQNFGENQTALSVLRVVGGVGTLQRIAMGPANSGQSGYRMLIIPN